MKARDPVGLGLTARRLPRVEAEVMVVTAGRDEQNVARCPPARHPPRFRDDVEAEDVNVEGAHAIDVGGSQMDVADPHTRIHGVRAPGDWCDVALLFAQARTTFR